MEDTIEVVKTKKVSKKPMKEVVKELPELEDADIKDSTPENTKIESPELGSLPEVIKTPKESPVIVKCACGGKPTTIRNRKGLVVVCMDCGLAK